MITGFGNRVHKLSLDLELINELELPVDHAHNGISLLSDGMMITRNLEHDHSKSLSSPCSIPRHLEVLIRHEFLGASIGRFCVDPTPEGDYIYATTPTRIHRLKYKDQQLVLDENWGASYDLPGEDQSFAWCNTVGDDSVWFMDMGDTPPLETIMCAYPVGTETHGLFRAR